eukprot:5316568-Amphidinium_carterae.1
MPILWHELSSVMLPVGCNSQSSFLLVKAMNLLRSQLELCDHEMKQGVGLPVELVVRLLPGIN